MVGHPAAEHARAGDLGAIGKLRERALRRGGIAQQRFVDAQVIGAEELGAVRKLIGDAERAGVAVKGNVAAVVLGLARLVGDDGAVRVAQQRDALLPAQVEAAADVSAVEVNGRADDVTLLRHARLIAREVEREGKTDENEDG